MKILATSNTNDLVRNIVLISIATVVVLGVGFILFYKLFLQKRRCNKILHNLQTKYEYYNALLTGQDNSYIQRLEIISRTNLLYNDIHSSYYKRSREIKDGIDASCQELIIELGNCLDENRISDFKAILKSKQGIISQYAEVVEQLNKDLMNVIKPEEDARQAALAEKEKLRNLKSKYHMNESELIFVGNSYENYFSKIEDKFKYFDNLIEDANYDEANAILPVLAKAIDNLTALIDQLPPLLNEINHDIPLKVEELENRYNKITSEGKPLKHLQVERKLEEIDRILQLNREAVKNLNIVHISQNDEYILKVVDSLNAEFDKEETSFEEFSKKKEDVINNFLYLEKEYIRLTNNISRFEKIYKIDDENKQYLTNIKSTIDEVSRDKRQLDQCLHGFEFYPYSELLAKLKVLESGSAKIKDLLNNFTVYLNSLRNDSETAYKNIEAKYFMLKKVEESLREIKNDKYNDKFRARIQDCYDLLDSIYKLLKTVPIDITLVNSYTSELNEKSSSLFAEVQEIKHYRDLATENILLINRDRMKFAEINNIISQAETLFESGDFKSSYQMSEEAHKKLILRDQQ